MVQKNSVRWAPAVGEFIQIDMDRIEPRTIFFPAGINVLRSIRSSRVSVEIVNTDEIGQLIPRWLWRMPMNLPSNDSIVRHISD